MGKRGLAGMYRQWRVEQGGGKGRRFRRRLTATKVAREIGVYPPRYCAFERGKVLLTAEELSRLNAFRERLNMERLKRWVAPYPL